MAKTPKIVDENPDADISKALLSSFLNGNKTFHDNAFTQKSYLVSTGSINLDARLEGGLGPGIHRFTGYAEGGKTSCALNVMKTFLETHPKGKGFYVKAEGKLGPDIQERSGVNFVSDPNEWNYGTCFILKSNIFEFVCENIRGLLEDSDSGNEYFIIVDSMDGLIPQASKGQAFIENKKVAGGALLATVLFKEVGGMPENRGHIMIIISQVRTHIELDKYAPKDKTLSHSSGAKVLDHYPTWMLEFDKRAHGDDILTNPSEKADIDKNPILGHYAKVTIKKSPKELTSNVIKYPIKHGMKGGKSVWIQYEIVEVLLRYNQILKKGAWYSVSPDMMVGYEGEPIEIPEKFQGITNFYELLDKNPTLLNFLEQKVKNIIF